MDGIGLCCTTGDARSTVTGPYSGLEGDVAVGLGRLFDHLVPGWVVGSDAQFVEVFTAALTLDFVVVTHRRSPSRVRV